MCAVNPVGKSGIDYGVVEKMRKDFDRFAEGKIPGIQAARIEIVRDPVDGHIIKAYLRGFKHTKKIDEPLTQTEINQLCLEQYNRKPYKKVLTERQAAPPEPVIIDRGNKAIDKKPGFIKRIINALKGNPGKV